MLNQRGPSFKERERQFRWKKIKNSGSIWWKDIPGSTLWIFSFDKKEEFNMYQDYPHKLTPEQKKIFDKENPYWARFFEYNQK